MVSIIRRSVMIAQSSQGKEFTCGLEMNGSRDCQTPLLLRGTATETTVGTLGRWEPRRRALEVPDFDNVPTKQTNTEDVHANEMAAANPGRWEPKRGIEGAREAFTPSQTPEGIPRRAVKISGCGGEAAA